MKLKKKTTQYNILNLKLINYRIFLGLNKIFFFFFDTKYIKGFRNNFSIFELLYTKSFLKKALKIIYKYHKKKKKIFFVGFNDIYTLTNYKLLFYKTKHSFISNFWVNNLLTNRVQVLYHFKRRLIKKKIINFKVATELFNILTTPDIVVMLNNKFPGLDKEMAQSKLPLVSLLNNSNKVNRLGYKVLGNFEALKSKIFVYLLLKSVLSFSK
jgi:ribosomal protein S2